MTQDQMKEIERIFADYATKINQSTKQENSGLIRELSGLVATLDANFKNYVATSTETIKDHETRIRANETWRVGLTAIIAFIMATGAIGTWLVTTSFQATVQNIVDDNTKELKKQVEDIPKMIQDYYEVTIDTL